MVDPTGERRHASSPVGQPVAAMLQHTAGHNGFNRSADRANSLDRMPDSCGLTSRRSPVC